VPTFRSTCPRHCYGSCGIISHINGNKLTRVLGDLEHGFTRGRLCPKGYALVQYSLDQNRLKYPMKQLLRGSSEWRRISWEEAYTMIAEKILDLNLRYGSNLALGYFLGKGNAGFLHQAVKGMFASLGPHTKPVGDICSAAGDRALFEVLGKVPHPDPENMADAGLIVLWGANPAITNINQMKFIYEARTKGTPFIVIDPIFTKSAQRADVYLQINPGTDALLAWGIAKIIFERDKQKKDFLEQKTIGWEEFRKEVEQLNLEEVSTRTGVSAEAMKDLAGYYINFRPVINWLGFGCQRNRYGEQTVKAVSALNALTGDYGIPGGGLYFRNSDIEDFPQSLGNLPEKKHPEILSSREIEVSDYASGALKLKDPPLKLLWISSGNPLAQDHNIPAWKSLFSQLELIVTVDLYLTRTAEQSDLILPAASFFEEEDLHISFWHHWLSMNQKVLPAFYQAKSDLQITRELVAKLNTLQPGFSDFPVEKEPLQWIESEFTSHIYDLYGLDNPSILYEHPVKRKKEENHSSWKYVFAKPLFDVFRPSEQQYPYLLLTPQSLLKFHTQYETLDWLNSDQKPVIEISEKIAHQHHINDGSEIEIFNNQAFLRGIAKINEYLPNDMIVMEQSGNYPVNELLESFNFFDCKVNIRRLNKYV